MNTKTSKFQIIILAVFVIFIIVGVGVFALYKGNTSSSVLPTITIWGSFPKDVFDQYVNKIAVAEGKQLTINYTEVDQSQFNAYFVAALARGGGPDAILIPTELLLPHEDKLALIPFSYMTQRDFMDTYIQEAKVYLNPNGIIGFPFTIDPLVMYWNRDMFDAAGIATYPKLWDDFADLNKSLTIKDKNGNLRKSAIALGQFGNINNAREIFGSLLLQSGNPITTLDSRGNIITNINTGSESSVETVIKFFAQFVDPANPSYSWNRSMPTSQAAFLSGVLATYFGFASELSDIRVKNPNINFDVALLPGPKSTGGTGATYGRMFGFSLVKTSPNLSSALQIIELLTSSQYLGDFSDKLYLPNVRRDVITRGSNDPYITLFNRAALVSATWLDADPDQSGRIFSDMVQSFTSGQKDIYQAIQDAGGQYNTLLQSVIPSQ